MAPLAPGPLAADLPLAAVVPSAPSYTPLGVWLCGIRRPAPVVMERARRYHALMIDGDLGRLLRACPAVVVRLGAAAVVVPAGELTRVRTLRVVLDRSERSAFTAIRGLFPDSVAGARGVEIVLGQRSAEELLALCATARIPVVHSQVVYGTLAAGPAR